MGKQPICVYGNCSEKKAVRKNVYIRMLERSTNLERHATREWRLH